MGDIAKDAPTILKNVLLSISIQIFLMTAINYLFTNVASITGYTEGRN